MESVAEPEEMSSEGAGLGVDLRPAEVEDECEEQPTSAEIIRAEHNKIE